MIRQLDGVFVLDTENTTYSFRVTESGHLEHLYYGKRITVQSPDDVMSLAEKQSFSSGSSVIYSEQHPKLTLENLRLEISSYG